MVGNYQEIGRLLDFMDRFDEETRRVNFIKHFQHLKPEELKLPQSIAERIVNSLVGDVIDSLQETEKVNDIKTKESEMVYEDKDRVKDDESGFFEDVSNTSLVM